MTLTYELVDGAASAEVASQILGEAWTPPAIAYTPEYLSWQFGFPGPSALSAVMAFDGSDPAGFAGATWRRVRCGLSIAEIALVSFVAVRPACRGKGIAAGLYRNLLNHVRTIGCPVVTFAIAGSAGENILLRAYAEAGFQIRSLGAYPKYACMPRQATAPEGDVNGLPDAIARCIADAGILWSDPSPEQILHYRKDPRPRVLLTLKDAAAWAIRLDVRTQSLTTDTVTTLDSVWLPRTGNIEALQRFASQAAAWDARPGTVISLPSLYGYEAAELRRIGIRQTGVPFNGYYCESGPGCLPDTFQGTSLEIV